MADEKPHDVSELSESALKCRDLGHAWQVVRDFNYVMGPKGEPSQFKREVVCRDCGASRTNSYHPDSGSSSQQKYEYADDYLLAHGVGRIYGSAVRVELFRRYADPTPVEDEPAPSRRAPAKRAARKRTR